MKTALVLGMVVLGSLASASDIRFSRGVRYVDGRRASNATGNIESLYTANAAVMASTLAELMPSEATVLKNWQKQHDHLVGQIQSAKEYALSVEEQIEKLDKDLVGEAENEELKNIQDTIKRRQEDLNSNRESIAALQKSVDELRKRIDTKAVTDTDKKAHGNWMMEKALRKNAVVNLHTMTNDLEQDAEQVEMNFRVLELMVDQTNMGAYLKGKLERVLNSNEIMCPAVKNCSEGAKSERVSLDKAFATVKQSEKGRRTVAPASVGHK